jgi:SOS-response transcriptional repressor LexA
MQKRKLFLCVLICSALPVTAGFCQQAKFDVKTGLWEQTVVSHTTGAPPLSDDMKAQLTPEQQKKMADAMAASNAKAAQPHTARVCMSQDKMDRGFTQEADRPGCKQTVVTNTPTVLEVRQECSDPTGNMVITLRYRALNRETVTGKTHFEMTREGQTMVSDGTIQGKWVSDSCGDVK